jgi:hypothetical protein
VQLYANSNALSLYVRNGWSITQQLEDRTLCSLTFEPTLDYATPRVAVQKDVNEEDALLSRAKSVLLSMMPKKEEYRDAPQDMIAFLLKRDFKWKFAIDQELIDGLGDAVLPTRLFVLSWKEADALRGLYVASSKQKEGESMDETDLLIMALSSRLQLAIDATRREFGVDHVFMKLSFMSPKDVATRIENESTRTCFAERINAQLQDEQFAAHLTSFLNSNDDVPNAKEMLRSASYRNFFVTLNRLFVDSLYASLRMKDAYAGLMTLAASSRCYEELSEAVVGPEAYFRTCLVLRPWVRIRPGHEFRVYVSDGVITCASQYESVYYEMVWNRREWLQCNVGDFVRNRVIPNLKVRLPSFVVDVVMGEDERFYVCELNPFAATSSGCQFSWSEDRTRLMIGPETWRFQCQETSRVEFLSAHWIAWLRETFADRLAASASETTTRVSVPFVFMFLLVTSALYSSFRQK